MNAIEECHLVVGILIEGIDCILSAAVGLGFGVTSCSQNIGIISLTKVYFLTTFCMLLSKDDGME